MGIVFQTYLPDVFLNNELIVQKFASFRPRSNGWAGVNQVSPS